MGLDLHIFSVKRHPDKVTDSKLTVENFINLERYFTFKNFELGEAPNVLSALEKDALPFYEATCATPGSSSYYSIFTEEVYWRKQWQIFQAFYDIAESYGITLDNCDYFEVIKDDIEEVLNKCFVIKKVNDFVEGGVLSNEELCTVYTNIFNVNETPNEWQIKGCEDGYTMLQELLNKKDYDNYRYFFEGDW